MMDKEKNGKNFRINDDMVDDSTSDKENTSKEKNQEDNGSTFEINDSSAK